MFALNSHPLLDLKGRLPSHDTILCIRQSSSLPCLSSTTENTAYYGEASKTIKVRLKGSRERQGVTGSLPVIVCWNSIGNPSRLRVCIYDSDSGHICLPTFPEQGKVLQRIQAYNQVWH